MSKRYKRTKKRKLNRRRVGLVLIFIILIITACIYNSVKPKEQTAETIAYSGPTKINKCIVIKHVGKCGVCGKRLTDDESIKRGFGIYCYKKYILQEKR